MISSAERSPNVDLHLARTDDLSAERLAAIRALLDVAFDGDFSDDDWTHTLGGWHVIADDAGVVAHAAVVERTIVVADRAWRAGYVEGVATLPARQRQGLGVAVMSRAGEVVQRSFEFGVLSTGAHTFYERLGWERWLGPSYVRTAAGLVRSAEDDDGIMVLRCASTTDLDRTGPIACEARLGDDW